MLFFVIKLRPVFFRKMPFPFLSMILLLILLSSDSAIIIPMVLDFILLLSIITFFACLSTSIPIPILFSKTLFLISTELQHFRHAIACKLFSCIVLSKTLILFVLVSNLIPSKLLFDTPDQFPAGKRAG